MTEPLLEIKNLSVLFPEQGDHRLAVDNLSLSIRQGECLAIVGESGSGKSLTALAAMQLLPIAARVDASSQVLWKDKNILTYSERQMRHVRGRHIAMIFQDAMSALNPVLTIGQQMQEVLKLHLNLNTKKGHCRAIDLLDEVGIHDPGLCYAAYPHQLSGGMRQRAMIAMALCAEPELLIADEPTTALDVTIQAQVLALLKSLQKNKNMTLLFISHDLGVVSHLADDVCVLQQGKCVEVATSTAFFQSPQHEYSKKLLDAIPKPQTKEHVEEHTDPILKVNNLKVYFPIKKGIFKRHVSDVKAVDDVSFSIPRGKTLALVGESGSGKTTVAKAIIHLINITHGDVRFNDTELANLSNRQFNRLRSDLQIIFQDPQAALNPRMMIADSIMEGMITQHILSNREERLAEVDTLLNRVGLSPQYKWRYPHEFSGGERQRICIARALALKPKLLLLDEPTSALDVSIQKQVLQLLKELQEQFNLTYLLITHDLAVVSYLAERVMVLRHGKVIEHNTADAILNNPQHEYTKELLHAVL